MELVEQKFRKMHADISHDLTIDVSSLKRTRGNETLHIGERISNLECLAQETFRSAMRKTRVALDSCAASPEDFNVIVVCRQGRHRSVATSEPLAEVAQRRTGCTIAGPFHLSRVAWHNRLCYTFEAWSEMHEEKTILFHKFATWW